jgi:hypothetical protein
MWSVGLPCGLRTVNAVNSKNFIIYITFITLFSVFSTCLLLHSELLVNWNDRPQVRNHCDSCFLFSVGVYACGCSYSDVSLRNKANDKNDAEATRVQQHNIMMTLVYGVPALASFYFSNKLIISDSCCVFQPKNVLLWICQCVCRIRIIETFEAI